MPVNGAYEPSSARWARDQVELYESSGGTEGATLLDTGMPVVIVTHRGASTDRVRTTPLMRVELDGAEGGDAVVREVDGPERALWMDRAVVA